MTDHSVIKGGAQVSGNASVTDYAIVAAHSLIRDSALISGHAVIDHSIVAGNAHVSGSAIVKDSFIGGDVVLDTEYIGKNGNITSSSHFIQLRIKGTYYTVHRVLTPKKGFGVQVMRGDGIRISERVIQELITSSEEHRLLQKSIVYLKAQIQKEVSLTPNDHGVNDTVDFN